MSEYFFISETASGLIFLTQHFLCNLLLQCFNCTQAVGATLNVWQLLLYLRPLIDCILGLYWLFLPTPFGLDYRIFCHLATVIHRISADNMLLLPKSKCPKHCIRNSVRARQRTKEQRQRMFFVLVENHCFASVFFF